MKKILVYDLLTRFFHWIFAGLFVVTFAIAKLVDDESPTFSYHMLLGLTLTLAVLLRIIWGFVGSKYARFSSFELNPKGLIEYFKGIVTGGSKMSLGHNPASSWSASLMLLFALGLGVSGFLMSQGQKEQLEDVHEVFGNLFLATAIAHVAGIIIHTVRHKDPIGLSMITGRKNSSSPNGEIKNSHSAAGFIFVLIVCLFGVYLFKNYDSNQRTVSLFGKTLQLGENESEEHGNKNEKENDPEDGD